MKLIGLLVLFFSTASALPLVNFEVSVGGVQQKPSGFVSYKGDNIDLKKDAKVSDETNAWAKLKFEHPVPIIPNVKLSYMPMKFEGKGVLQRNITFGNRTFSANADYEFSTDVSRADATLFYNVPFVGLATAGLLDVELGVNVRYVLLDAKLTGREATTNRTIAESKSANFPLPMGHLAASLTFLGKVSVKGEVNAISLGKNSYYDYSAGVALSPIKLVTISPFIELGYREEKLKTDISDIKSDIKVNGFYGMLGIKF